MAKSLEARIKEALKKVPDPELRVNIVDLGLIYDIEVRAKTAVITMTLTTPGCPMAPIFEAMICEAVKKVPGIAEVKVLVTFDPPWDASRMTGSARSALGF